MDNNSNYNCLLTRIVGSKPVNDRYKIIQLENCVGVNLNKHAKKPYGEGTMCEYYVGDCITKEQAVQLCTLGNSTIIENQTAPSFEEFIGVSKKPTTTSIEEIVID